MSFDKICHTDPSKMDVFNGFNNANPSSFCDVTERKKIQRIILRITVNAKPFNASTCYNAQQLRRNK